MRSRDYISKYYRMCILILVIIIILLLVGCWDTRDIQDKNIITSTIIDYKNGKYIFYGEIINMTNLSNSNNKDSSGTMVNSTYIFSEGDDFLQARDKLNLISEKEIYLGAAREVIFTDAMAINGIEQYLNRMRGSADYRKSIDLFTTSSSPAALLKDIPENAISTGFAIEELVKSMQGKGWLYHVDVGTVLQALAVKKVGFLITAVELFKGENTIVGYSVFKDSKKIGEIPDNERKGLLYLLLPRSNSMYDVNLRDNEITINISLVKKRVKVIYINGEIEYDVRLSFKSSIRYLPQTVSLSEADVDTVISKLNSMIKEDVKKTIVQSQKEFECDYLNFYKYFRAKYPRVFESADWNKLYSEANINIYIFNELNDTNMLEINIDNK